MRTLRTVIVGLVLVARLQPGATANAGVFYGAGHTVRLDKTEKVQLVEEVVTITPGRGRLLFDGGADWVDYSCQFTLRNLDDEAVEIQVGFPLTAQWFRRGEPVKQSEAQLVEQYRFIARDDAMTYHVRFVERDAEKRFHHLFLWTMTFAPGETRMLRVSYGMPMNVALMPLVREYSVEQDYPWMGKLDTAMLESFGYVTETGTSWVGPIETATFRLYTHGFETYLRQRPRSENPNPPPEGVIPKHRFNAPALWHRVVLPDGGKPFFDERHPDRTLGIEWKYAPFEPGPDVGAAYYVTVLPCRPEDMLQFCKLLVEHEQVELQPFREIVAAFFGIEPASESVLKFVRNQIWYAPVEGKTEAGCTVEERALLSAIDAAIVELATASR